MILYLSLRSAVILRTVSEPKNKHLMMVLKGAAVVLPMLATYLGASYESKSVQTQAVNAKEAAVITYELMVQRVRFLEKNNLEQTGAMVEMAKQLAITQGRLQTMEAIYIQRPPSTTVQSRQRIIRRQRVNTPAGVPPPKLEPSQLVQQLQKQEQVQQKATQTPLPANLDSAVEKRNTEAAK